MDGLKARWLGLLLAASLFMPGLARVAADLQAGLAWLENRITGTVSSAGFSSLGALAVDGTDNVFAPAGAPSKSSRSIPPASPRRADAARRSAIQVYEKNSRGVTAWRVPPYVC